ncbi:MAG: hypothetical protein SGI92_27790, partial [Bryobacteraceae bacterium]|nr:hypothetical protein [Bryobacteraceae bacterium]
MKLLCPLFSLLLGTAAVCHAAVSVSPADSAPLRFAAAEIEGAVKNTKRSVPDVTISVTAGAAQSYRIERDGAKVRIIGGDATGAMYGGLDVAEAIRTGALDSVKDSPVEHSSVSVINFMPPIYLGAITVFTHFYRSNT